MLDFAINHNVINKEPSQFDTTTLFPDFVAPGDPVAVDEAFWMEAEQRLPQPKPRINKVKNNPQATASKSSKKPTPNVRKHKKTTTWDSDSSSSSSSSSSSDSLSVYSSSTASKPDSSSSSSSNSSSQQKKKKWHSPLNPDASTPSKSKGGDVTYVRTARVGYSTT